MTMTVDFVDADLTALLDRTPAGEEIILAEAGKPYARVVKLDVVPAARAKRRPGGWPELEALCDEAMTSPITGSDMDAWERKFDDL